jgi:hypothetical protein
MVVILYCTGGLSNIASGNLVNFSASGVEALVLLMMVFRGPCEIDHAA